MLRNIGGGGIGSPVLFQHWERMQECCATLGAMPPMLRNIGGKILGKAPVNIFSLPAGRQQFVATDSC